MRVKRSIIKMPASLLFLAVLVFFSPTGAQAHEINFFQSILPVKFVYLDAKGGIEKIWSNVSPADNLYVLKFFDARKKTELAGGQEFFGKYLSYAERQPRCEFFSGGKVNRTMEYKKTGNTLEEIQTVV